MADINAVNAQDLITRSENTDICHKLQNINMCVKYNANLGYSKFYRCQLLLTNLCNVTISHSFVVHKSGRAVR